MREFELELDEYFKNGLRLDESNPVGSPFLVELKNARPSVLGLRPYVATSLPYDSEQSFYVTDHVVRWPFPQVFFTKKYRLVGTKERMYVANDLGKLTSLFGYDSTERWDLADMGEYMLAAKDGTAVWERAITGGWGPSADIPLCRSLIDLNGQVFVGGLSPWGTWTDLSERHVAWSDIGSSKFTLDRRNEAGYREYDFSGPIVEVKKLGQVAVVYGYNGIAAFQPIADPAPTFAYKNIAKVGLYNKGAVAGSDEEHCFVGSDGYIYKLNSQLKLTKVGYQEYMTQLSNGTVIVNYDSSEGDYYFSDGVKSFLLTDNGLAEIFQRISTLEYYNGVKYGVSSDDTDSSFLAVTDRVDFGLRGRKSIECFESATQGGGSLSAAIDWRNSASEAFRRTSFVPFSDQGVANIKVSASEFRFVLKCTNYTDALVGSVKVRYKLEDMRSIRGIYAPPPRGQYAG